jgi:hypothetical protein
MQSVVILSVVMLNVANKPFMLCVAMLNVVMLSVVVPFGRFSLIIGVNTKANRTKPGPSFQLQIQRGAQNLTGENLEVV